MALRCNFSKQTMSIRYYNVLFFLTYRKHIDEFKMEQLAKIIAAGELMTMKVLSDWCKNQDISFSTKFIYRKDFPLKANIWNLYSYYRFLIETKKI